MPFFLLFTLVLTPVFAAQVVTLDKVNSGSEILIVSTESSFNQNLAKNIPLNGCKTKSSDSLSLHEYYYRLPCRAQLIQFILDQGFKPSENFKTFTKD